MSKHFGQLLESHWELLKIAILAEFEAEVHFEVERRDNRSGTSSADGGSQQRQLSPLAVKEHSQPRSPPALPGAQPAPGWTSTPLTDFIPVVPHSNCAALLDADELGCASVSSVSSLQSMQQHQRQHPHGAHGHLHHSKTAPTGDAHHEPVESLPHHLSVNRQSYPSLSRDSLVNPHDMRLVAEQLLTAYNASAHGPYSIGIHGGGDQSLTSSARGSHSSLGAAAPVGCPSLNPLDYSNLHHYAHQQRPSHGPHSEQKRDSHLAHFSLPPKRDSFIHASKRDSTMSTASFRSNMAPIGEDGQQQVRHQPFGITDSMHSQCSHKSAFSSPPPDSASSAFGMRAPYDLDGSASATSYASQDGAQPGVFDLLPGWTKQKRSGGVSERQRSTMKKSGRHIDGSVAGALSITEGNGYPCVVLPRSRVRLLWDWMSLLFIAYDTFVLPLEFVDMTQNDFTIVMSWLTRLFWTSDMVLSCFTAYTTHSGTLEFRTRKIMAQYLRTWFIFDCTVCATDWASSLLEAVDGIHINRLRSARLVRLIRIVKVLGLLHATTHLSERVTVLSNMLLSVIAIIALMHLVGCIWYGLGASYPAGWVLSAGIENEQFWARYSRSIFWASGIFTGLGSVNSLSITAVERNFVTAVLICSLVVVTCFISSFTSSLTQLAIISRSVKDQFAQLHKYMQQHQISVSLCARITQNAKFVLFQKQAKTPEEDVELLKLISEPLRRDLHHELYSSMLEAHPLFNIVDEFTMKHLCHHSVHLCQFSKGDVLFGPGEIPLCPELLLLASGVCMYVYMRHSTKTVGPITVLNEPALWTNWVYRGLVQCTTDCQILQIHGETIMQVSDNNSYFDFLPYAELYAESLNDFKAVVTDLGRDIDIQQLVGNAYANLNEEAETVKKRWSFTSNKKKSKSRLFSDDD